MGIHLRQHIDAKDVLSVIWHVNAEIRLYSVRARPRRISHVLVLLEPGSFRREVGDKLLAALRLDGLVSVRGGKSTLTHVLLWVESRRAPVKGTYASPGVLRVVCSVVGRAYDDLTSLFIRLLGLDAVILKFKVGVGRGNLDLVPVLGKDTLSPGRKRVAGDALLGDRKCLLWLIELLTVAPG